jgi:hypothetical protein
VTDIPRGKYLGKRLGDPPKDDAEHFIRCPACGGWIDCRDLAQVFEHEGPCHTRLRIRRNDDSHSFRLPGRSLGPARRKHPDFQVAQATFEAECKRWPGETITLRQGARVIEDSRKTGFA